MVVVRPDVLVLILRIGEDFCNPSIERIVPIFLNQVAGVSGILIIVRVHRHHPVPRIPDVVLPNRRISRFWTGEHVPCRIIAGDDPRTAGNGSAGRVGVIIVVVNLIHFVVEAILVEDVPIERRVVVLLEGFPVPQCLQAEVLVNIAGLTDCLDLPNPMRKSQYAPRC